jgi:acyl-CoA thioester hydrolase
MLSSVTKIRVRYADTDQMKFVYYSKYLEYFEQGRSDLLREVGMPYPQIEEMGYYLPVVESYVKYHQPARYDDLLEVNTVLREVPVVLVRIEYQVLRPDDSANIAEGHTVHCVVDAATGKPVRAPKAFVERLAAAFTKGVKPQQAKQEV